jgi:hypothetical protein
MARLSIMGMAKAAGASSEAAMTMFLRTAILEIWMDDCLMW